MKLNNTPTTDAPPPFYGARGEPGTLRRAIVDAIDMYLHFECDTDSERAHGLAVEYMFGEYGLEDGDLSDLTRLRAELDQALALASESASLRAELAAAQRDNARLFHGMRQASEELDEARQRERAAGADVVALVNAASAYLAVMTWCPANDPNWEPRHLIPDYRTPEKRLAKLLKGPARPHVELLKDLIKPAKTINDLRARLDTALSHIGALLSEGADEDTQDAARAWLRRA